MDAHTDPESKIFLSFWNWEFGKSNWTHPPHQFYVLIAKFFSIGVWLDPSPPNWDNVLKSASFFYGIPNYGINLFSRVITMNWWGGILYKLSQLAIAQEVSLNFRGKCPSNCTIKERYREIVDSEKQYHNIRITPKIYCA